MSDVNARVAAVRERGILLLLVAWFALTIAAGASAAGSAPSAEPDTGVHRASSGAVSAELTYRKTDSGFRNVRLAIVRSDVKAVDVEVPGLAEPGTFIRSFSVRDLDGGEPEVVFGYYTGSAYCCTVSRIYRYVPSRRAYAVSTQDWGVFGFRLVDRGGDRHPEFESGDVRLDQAFTAHVISSAPIRIFRYSAGVMLDVTRNFPARVLADLGSSRSTYLEARGDRTLDVRGLLVSYIGDLYLLNRVGEARSVLAAAERRGELSRGSYGPTNKAYVRALLSVLHKTGYARTISAKLPASRCSASGDVCYGLEQQAGELLLRITTVERYFPRYDLCVAPPRGPRTCRTFPITRSGQEYGSTVNWAREFPAAGVGVYRASWDGHGPSLSFRVS